MSDFGEEQITAGTHLEKLCLIRGGVGRDSIGDFTTNLIKHYLLDYTQKFAKVHIAIEQCKTVSVPRARFNYETETWQTEPYLLPVRNGDFVLLTPADLLTRDETWISYPDMVQQFAQLPAAVPDDQVRSQINNYFRGLLQANPTAKEYRAAAQRTITRFPILADYYIRKEKEEEEEEEEEGDRAEAVSARESRRYRSSACPAVAAGACGSGNEDRLLRQALDELRRSA